MTRTPYTDSCPECLLTTNQPHHTEPVNHGAGVFGHYRCPLCDHTWTCSWIAEPQPEPHDGTPVDGYAAGPTS